MIEATVDLKKGGTITIYAVDFRELFEKLKGYDMCTMFARVIRSRDMRQGWSI